MPTRPPIGLEVTLEQASGAALAAEVTGYDGFDVLLSPSDTVDEAPPAGPETAPCDVPVVATLSWTTDRGLFRAPVTATRSHGRWRVSFQAQADRIQRRGFARLPMGTPMTLSHERGTMRGTLVDVSEAALRARLDTDQQPALHPGDSVRAAFTLHHTGFMLRGTVLREQPSEVAEAVEVVIMLEIPARTANDLRRNVVFEQVERQSDHHREKRRDLP